MISPITPKTSIQDELESLQADKDFCYARATFGEHTRRYTRSLLEIKRHFMRRGMSNQQINSAIIRMANDAHDGVDNISNAYRKQYTYRGVTYNRMVKND